MGKFGYKGTPYEKQMYEAFKQDKKRTSAAENSYIKGNDIVNKMNKYYDVGWKRPHFGGLEVTAAGSAESGQNMQFHENWQGPVGSQVMPDGSCCSWTGATRNTYSGSNIGTCIGPSDAITSANHDVTRSGCLDNTDMPKSGAKKNAGSKYHESGNDNMNFNAGKNLTVSGRSKAGGAVGDGSHIDIANLTKDDYGIGHSACKGDTWLAVEYFNGAGTRICAVGDVQAASDAKGNYTLTIDKQGNVTIVTKGKITWTVDGPIDVTTKEAMTIKAQSTTIDSTLHVTKQVTTDSGITSAGAHIASAHV